MSDAIDRLLVIGASVFLVYCVIGSLFWLVGKVRAVDRWGSGDHRCGGGS